MYDVAIIGGGIIGAVTARELTKYNVSVCVLEKENDVAMGATKANSAIVHAGFDAKPGTLKAKYNVLGSEMMKAICAELGVKYKNNGSVVLAFNNDDKKSIYALYEQGIENGVKGLKIIDSDELKKLEPNVSDNAICALYAPSGAIVCPYELCIAAVGNAMDNGADLKLNFEVTGIEKEDGFFNIISKSETVRAKYIVNAAGVYADKIAEFAGDNSFKIHPRRGEYILLDKECGTYVNHTVFKAPTKMGKGILVTPTVDGNLLTGPTAVDMEDKQNTETTAEGFANIIKGANESVKNVPYNKTITSFCGLRAVGDTGDFIINSPTERFVNAAAIESPGLSSSPAIAKEIVYILKDCGLKLTENKKFNPIRKPNHFFKDADVEQKNNIIKQDPSYGKIVCRCESVTEGEIIYAIRTNPGAHDVDGIKRRTRSGMGRCQGGFCLPYVCEILSRELNIPFASVTKCGKNSPIVTGNTKEDF